jgi:ankyrin repeat protein
MSRLKRRLIVFGLTVVTLVLLAIVSMACWLFWPNVNTLVHQAKSDDITGMQRSLFFGVDPNGFELTSWRMDCDGETPLTAAVRAGNIRAIRVLLKHGADPSLGNCGGKLSSQDTPLSLAAYHGRLEICRLLIDHDADPDAVTNPNQPATCGGKWTCLDWAIFQRHDEVAEYLQGVGASESGLRASAKIYRPPPQ